MCATVNVTRGIKRVLYSVLLRCDRHQGHQPHAAGCTDVVGVKVGLVNHNGFDQARIHAVFLAWFTDHLRHSFSIHCQIADLGRGPQQPQVSNPPIAKVFGKGVLVAIRLNGKRERHVITPEQQKPGRNRQYELERASNA